MMANAPNNGQDLGARLRAEVLDPMKAQFVGKDEVIDLLGVSLAAGENLFILGPPGTAKSALVHELGRRLDGRTFDYLLTRFTEPNELFGPFDIRKLREGELVTNTEGMLPEAALVFLDELLNANSAILNSLLTVLNERVFRRGRESRPLPTLMVVGASNRLPEDDALAALFDRFLLRVQSDCVPDDRLSEVLEAGWKLDGRTEPPPATLSIADVRKLSQQVRQVDLAEVRTSYVELVHRLRKAGFEISDRRAVKLQRLVAASALVCGRTAADDSDLWIFRYIWDTQEQQEVLRSLVDEALGRRPAHERSHGRSRLADRPDPESLARDLDALEGRLGQTDLPDGERSAAVDRLGILAHRCAWVSDERARAHLSGKVDELCRRFGKKS